MEAAAGALSRAFASATVEADPDIAMALSPRALAQIGRDLVRVGESLHVIRMTAGALRLAPASTWYWEGNENPADWTCTATTYGPSGSTHMARAVRVGPVRDVGQSYRPALSRAGAGVMGAGYRPPQRQCRTGARQRGRRTRRATAGPCRRTAATAATATLWQA